MLVVHFVSFLVHISLSGKGSVHVFYCTQWSYSLNQQQNYMAIYMYIMLIIALSTDKKSSEWNLAIMSAQYCVHVFYCTAVIV